LFRKEEKEYKCLCKHLGGEISSEVETNERITHFLLYDSELPLSKYLEIKKDAQKKYIINRKWLLAAYFYYTKMEEFLFRVKINPETIGNLSSHN
jgi:hypothetical protein